MIHTLLDFKNKKLVENNLIAIKYVGESGEFLWFIDYRTNKLNYLYSYNFYSDIKFELIPNGCYVFSIKNTHLLQFEKFLGVKEQDIMQKFLVSGLMLKATSVYIG